MNISIPEIDITELKNMLNPSAFTPDSIEGILVILLAIFVVYHISEKALKMASWCAGGIIILQIGYILSQTGLNNYIPLDQIFQYDVLTAIAQVFVGTKFSDFLLTISAWLSELMTLFAGVILDILRKLHLTII